MCRLFGALGWFVVTCLGHARAAEEIRTFGQFYQLSLPQSREGRPVRIQGVVVCHDLDWGQLYVHDGEGVLWFNPREFSTQPAVGQLVEITGKTTVTGNDLAWTNLSLTVLKEAALPAAKVVLPAQLTSGLGQWVEISGRVRVVDFSWGRMQLALHENGQGCAMFVLGPPQTNELKRLLGSRVRVRGINNSKIANGRLELASLFIPGMDQVTVLEPAGEGQLLPRATSIDSLLNRELGDWTNHPVRINGYVVSCEPGRKLIVKDPTGFMHVQIIQATEVRSDERVDVRGFLKVSPGETVLGDAWFEVIKPVIRPTAAAPAPASPAGPARRPEVLTRVADILKLRSDESAQRWPVRLRGVVLYAARNGAMDSSKTSGARFILT